MGGLDKDGKPKMRNPMEQLHQMFDKDEHKEMVNDFMGGKEGMEKMQEHMEGMQKGTHGMQDLLNSDFMKNFQERMKTEDGKKKMTELGKVMQEKMKDHPMLKNLPKGMMDGMPGMFNQFGGGAGGEGFDSETMVKNPRFQKMIERQQKVMQQKDKKRGREVRDLEALKKQLTDTYVERTKKRMKR